MRDTIDMARDAGFPLAWISDSGVIRWKDIKAFEALVRADEQEKYKWDVHSCGPTCKRYACVALREAVEAEREACAKLADAADMYNRYISQEIAAAIRDRGEN